MSTRHKTRCATRLRRHSQTRRAQTRRLRIESLEDRRMLAVFSVSNLDDGGSGSLRQAILDANDESGADSIHFNGALFSSPQTIALASALPTITEAVVITGPGHQLLTLDAGNGSDHLPGTGDGFRLLDIDDANASQFASVTVQGLTLTGGDVSGAGGAISSRENMTIIDVAIVNNATGPGALGTAGAVGQAGGDGGRGGDGGGIFSSGGDLFVVRSTLSGNSTGNGGNGGLGGDGADGTNGQGGGDGGYGGSGGYGGAIFSDGGNVVIIDSTLSGNSTGTGGLSGSAGQGGEGTVGGVGGRGGDGGYGGNGGGIYSSVGTLTITGSTISGNFTGAGTDGATGGDGGSGAANGDGGDGGNGGSGGGLYNVEGLFEISSSTITGNRTSNSGSAGAGGSGGESGSPGSHGEGGGIDSLGSEPLQIANTIIAANLAAGAAPDLRTGSEMLSIDYSLIGEGGDLLISSGTGNQIGTGLALLNPHLGPLASNGGPTETHALLPNSPAIDAGDPSIVFNASEFDQRGAPFLRVEDGNFVAGAFIDLGAYEAQAPPSADFDQDQDIDGADFLAWQRGFGKTSGALLAEGNSDDDEDVDASDLAVWQSAFGSETSTLQALQIQPPPPATSAATIPPGQALLTDLALATFDPTEYSQQSTEVIEPHFFSTETRATAMSELFAATAIEAETGIVDAITPSADSDSSEIIAYLHDELLSILF